MRIKSILKKCTSFLSTILFIVLLSVLFLSVASKAAGNEVNLFGYQVKSVLSGSMEPDIQTGSLIAIETGGAGERFQENDVITFQSEEDVLVTHRIVEVKNGGQQYVTKGDANNGADRNPLLAENIVGQYTGFTIPYAGYVMNFTSSREGAALLFIFPGILLIGYSLITIRSTLKEVKQLMNEKEIRA
ncbi:signal peptidase I SipW [Oceanobacillus profundus]|uniref:signal peptidase I SipW n=1 Tax=Oceanobacillus profundus TaxID=372463 RepID=UPI00363A8E33